MNSYKLDLEKYAALARQAAAEGCVLLENEEQALPLREGERVAVFGRMAFHYYKSGLGSGGLVNTRYVVGILDALKECETVHLDEKLMGIYEDWIQENPYDEGQGWGRVPWCQKEMEVTEEMLDCARDNDVSLIIIGRTAGEDQDNKAEAGSYCLTETEEDMIRRVCEVSRRTVVLLNVGNVIDMSWVKKYHPQAVLYVWQGGQEGGSGVADVLTGKVCACGKLTDTIAERIEDYPSTENFGDPFKNYYKEDIYVGYRYFETFVRDKVLYPFGYGLSYTTFTQELESVDVISGEKGLAKVKVTNTGDVAGKDVVQLYVQTPYIEGGLEKASIQLLDFGKTEVLEPGESQTLEIEFAPEYMASYDEKAVKEDGTEGAWVLDSGDYYFTIGNGAHEALNNVLAVKTDSTDDLITITDDETIEPENVVTVSLGEDKETYSENVENAFQDCDINNLIPDTAEYTTRSDWSKGWKEVESITPIEEMMKGLTNSAYELTENNDEEVVWGADNGLSTVDFLQFNEDGTFAGALPLSDEKWDQLMDQLTLEEAANFIEKAGDKNFEKLDSIFLPEAIWYDGPIGYSYDQIAGYATRWNESNSSEPTYVSSDNEYASYSMSSMPTEPVVAATFNKELVEREGELFGEDGLWSNANSIAAPGLNIHRAPYCSRNHEYYSEDAMLTNLLGQAVCKGGKSKGLMMMPKHYIMNHQELNRSGVSTFFTEQAARENELRAFQGAMENNYAQGIMTGFNRLGTVYSGASEASQVQVARNEWGFEGWIVTDMINGADYMNWRDIVFGGGGGCLTTSAYESANIGSMTSTENLKLIAKDSAFQKKMKETIKYFVYNTVASNDMNTITTSTKYIHVLTWWQIAFMAAEVVFGLLTLLFAVMYLRNSLRKKTVYVKEDK